MDASALPEFRVPLGALRVSAKNVRRGKSKSIEAMASSISAIGLLNNINVTPAVDGVHDIVAGRRRFEALKLLQERGQLPAGLENVPCRLVALDRAESASLAENVIREAMHPADEFEAFKRLADGNAPLEDIAQEFGVTPRVVLQRLKLASVSPKLFEQFRGDKITLAQMTALAVVDDHAQQEKAWDVRDTWERDPERIRARLTKAEINIATDPVARFVGKKAIQAAGVQLREDLFGEKGEAFANDRQTIDQLALDKLEVEAERIRGEGWSWVEAKVSFPYQQSHEYSRVHASGDTSKLTPDQRKKLAELEAEQKQLDEREDAEDDDLNEADWKRRSDIEDEITELEEACAGFSTKQLAAAGAVVTIDEHSGKLRIERGLVRPGQKNPDTSEQRAKKAKKKSGEYSEALARRITAHRTQILQGALLSNSRIALVVIVHNLLQSMPTTRGGRLYDSSRESESASMIRFGAPSLLTTFATELTETKHFKEQARAIAAVQKRLPPMKDLFDWLLDQQTATLLELLAYAVSQSIDTTENWMHRDDKKVVQPLAAALGIDFADYWTPTKESFLGWVPREVVFKTLDEAGCADVQLAPLRHMKKGALVEAAERLLVDKRWLPKVLRGPAAAAPKKKAAVKKKSTKKTAKRGAK